MRLNVRILNDRLVAHDVAVCAAAVTKSLGVFGVIFHQMTTNPEPSSGEAVKWFRKEAEEGDAKVQFVLGVCYKCGQGLSQDQADALAPRQGQPSLEERLPMSRYPRAWCQQRLSLSMSSADFPVRQSLSIQDPLIESDRDLHWGRSAASRRVMLAN